jgi:putative peptidoglycan lipid II flippase
MVVSRKFYIANDALLCLIGFSIATALSILFQNVVGQIVNSNVNGMTGNLIGADSLYFHQVAVNMAEQIKSQGWSAWVLYPAHGATGNVAVLAAMYVLFGVDPLVIVPINAFLHALSAMLILSIGRMAWPGRLGAVAGFVAASLFLFAPSALLWYGQVHKDGYLILGVLLVMHGWLASESLLINYWRSIGFSLLGVLLIILVKPYAVLLMFVGMLAMFAVYVFGNYFFSQSLGVNKRVILNKLAIIVMLALAGIFSPRVGVESQNYASWSADDNAAAYAWQWESTSWLPAEIDRAVEIAAKTRLGLIMYGGRVGAESIYDADALPSNAVDFVAYLPRAAQIGLFSPFPNRWTEKYSAARVLSVVETLVWYFAAAGILLGLISNYNSLASQLIVFCVLTVTIFGAISANVGSLYRIRFVYIELLILVGVGGWLTHFQKKITLKALNDRLRKSDWAVETTPSKFNEGSGRSGVAKSGVIVMLLTAITFLVFFVRDVLMARMFGLGSELDAFVIASAVPMFMVSAFSVPLGTAVVPFVSREKAVKRDDVSHLIQRILPSYLLCAAMFAALFAGWGVYMLHSSAWGVGLTQGQAVRVEVLSLWMLAIFVMSGFLTIANGVLNALGKSNLPAVAQLIVPALVLVALALFGESLGVIVVPIAMLFGQLCNLLLLIRGLWSEQVVLLPSKFGMDIPKEFLAQYSPLVIASVFMQISVPVSTMMTASLQSGDLAALGLGGKLVVFLTGLITAGLASVVLPYFSSMLVQQRVIDARRELSFMLLSATVASIPLTVFLYLCSSYIVKIFFEGGVFGANSTLLVASVMEFGALQLPFFVVNMIMLKYAIAMKRSRWVLVASLIGLLVNVVLNIYLSRLIGVVGVALAMSMSVAVTAGLMLLVFFREREVAWLDLIFIMVNWLLFVAMVVCLYFRSWAGLLAALLAFTLLLFGEWQTITRGRDIHVSA